MEIKILHLFYDLMNLYGEYGNVNVIKYRLEKQGATVSVDRKSIDDEISFMDYDFIYVGSGTEKNQLMALDYLKKYKNNLIEAINSNKFILFTGNSLELLGNCMITTDDKKIELLNIFDFHVTRTSDRIVGDVIIKTNYLENELVGFINKQANVEYKDFTSKVVFGIGADIENKCEGIRKNNLFGTYIIGPVLAKNPHFARLIEEGLLKGKDTNFEYKETNDYEEDEQGYKIILNELKSRMETK